MKIVVAYKWAADPQEASVGADGVVDFSRAKKVISDYDAVAITVARQLVDALGGEVIGLSVGGKATGEPMATKSALARGLDRTVVVVDESLNQAGTTLTAEVLATAITDIGEVDLVLAGDSSIDIGAKMVAAVLGGALGWTTICDVIGLRAGDGCLVVTRALTGGTQQLQLAGPAVLALTPDAAAVRAPGMKDVLAAGKKPVVTQGMSDLDADTSGLSPQLESVSKPAGSARRQQLIDVSDPARAAAELVAALRESAVL